MTGRLNKVLEIGRGNPFYVNNRAVAITQEEDHPIYGKRYKVAGYDEWFEANAFEYIEND